MNIPRQDVLKERPEGSRAQRRAEKTLSGNSKHLQLCKWFTVLYKYYKETNDSGVWEQLAKMIPYTRVKNPVKVGLSDMYDKTRVWVELFEKDIREYHRSRFVPIEEAVPMFLKAWTGFVMDAGKEQRFLVTANNWERALLVIQDVLSMDDVPELSPWTQLPDEVFNRLSLTPRTLYTIPRNPVHKLHPADLIERGRVQKFF